MGFDRSKLKKATQVSVEAMEAQEKTFSALRPKSGNFDISYHKIEDGDNIFRMAPYHPDGGGSTPIEAKTVSFLNVSVPKRDKDGRAIDGEKEIKRKAIFNSRVHGGYPYDLVETYINVAKAVAIPAFLSANNRDEDTELFNEIYKLIVGDRNSKEATDSIVPVDAWVCYAWKSTAYDKETAQHTWSNCRRLELKSSIRDAMKDRAAEIGTPDPWSDIDDGIAFVITKAGKLKPGEKRLPKDWYKVKCDSYYSKETRSTQYTNVQISDSMLEDFLKLDSLNKLFVNSFKRKDLLFQLEGLQNLDASLEEAGYPIAVFDCDEFKAIAEEMLSLVPEDTEEEAKEEEEEQKEVKKPTVLAPIKKPTVAAPKPSFKIQRTPTLVRAMEPQPQEEEETSEKPNPHLLKAKKDLNNVLSKFKKA